jgi:hypothetical protein
LISATVDLPRRWQKVREQNIVSIFKISPR